MKRYWPLFLALLCWLFVLIVPLTRHGLVTDWNILQHRGSPPNPALVIEDPADGAELRGRFPGDKRILTYIASLSQHNTELKIDNLRQRYPQDPVFVAMRLQTMMNNEVAWRMGGAISNPSGFMPPLTPGETQVDWTDFIELTRHGQRLEPNNSYFDWLLLFGLYAAHRDAEASAVLRSAAAKTVFDSHSRDLNLNNFEVLKLVHGSPVQSSEMVRISPPYFMYGEFVRVANWTMDVAVADRKAGNHQRALNNSLYLVKMARLMRRESQDTSAMDNGFLCEAIGLSNSQASTYKFSTIPNVLGNQGHGPVLTGQRLLENYATQQGRADIARFVKSEWAELGQWQQAGALKYPWLDNLRHASYFIVSANALHATLLMPLPFTLVLCAIFGALSWRFRCRDTSASAWWRGAVIGVVILVTQGVTLVSFPQMRVSIDTPQPMFTVTPNWVIYGIPFALWCTGLHQAARWQSNQQNPAIGIKGRLKRLFAPPEDGLVRFDLGWFFGLILRITYWVALPALFVLSYHQFVHQYGWPIDTDYVSALLLALAVGLSWGASFIGWLYWPKRAETRRQSFRLVYQTTSGYLIIASVLYAVVATTSLLIGLNYQTEWQRKFEIGHVKVARNELKLQ